MVLFLGELVGLGKNGSLGLAFGGRGVCFYWGVGVAGGNSKRVVGLRSLVYRTDVFINS